MNFKKQELNKKFDKNYFELSNILKMNQKNDNIKKEESTKENSSKTNNNSSTNNNSLPNNNTTTPSQNNNENTENKTNNNQSGNNNTTNNSNQNNNNNPSSRQETSSNVSPTAKINDVIYPMYLPDNTYLTSQDTVDTKDGSRLILTFGGDSSFVLVEETASKSDEGLVIPVSGEFDFLSDVIGIISNKSLSWHSNGIDYYMTSDTLEVAELVEIARSVSVLPVSK